MSIVVVKTEDQKGRERDREVVKIPMHLCDQCITANNQDLGHFVASIRKRPPVAAQEIKVDETLDVKSNVTPEIVRAS